VTILSEHSIELNGFYWTEPIEAEAACLRRGAGRGESFDAHAADALVKMRRYGLEWDHVDPVAHNGPTSFDNLRTRCNPIIGRRQNRTARPACSRPRSRRDGPVVAPPTRRRPSRTPRLALPAAFGPPALWLGAVHPSATQLLSAIRFECGDG
jgi:hypothetical protein